LPRGGSQVDVLQLKLLERCQARRADVPHTGADLGGDCRAQTKLSSVAPTCRRKTMQLTEKGLSWDARLLDSDTNRFLVRISFGVVEVGEPDRESGLDRVNELAVDSSPAVPGGSCSPFISGGKNGTAQKRLPTEENQGQQAARRGIKETGTYRRKPHREW
jgi:hypothetical protein